MSLSSRTPPQAALGATRARQGRLGRHVFWVLLVSVVLAAIALFGAWSWQAGNLASTEPNNARESADARAFDAPEPAAVTPQPEQKTNPATTPAP